MGYALEHLGPDRCREIAEGLFRVEKIYGTKLHGFCPIHGDKKSASFFYNWERDGFGCQSCGEKGDLVNLWCILNNYDRQDVKAFKEEFDIEHSGSPAGARKPAKGQNAKPKNQFPEPIPEAPEVFIDDEELQALPPLPDETVNELRRIRHWEKNTIQLLDLREFVDSRGKKRIAIPVLDDQGRLCNIRLYLPGAEEYKLISWYDKKCLKCGGAWKTVNKKKICKECGSPPNDYGRTRLWPPPAHWKPGTLWLCEGEPDTICALSHGLNAVTQTAGCGTWREEFSQAMAGRDVIVCFDADKPGYKGAMNAAESLTEHAKSVRVLIWPDMMGESFNERTD